MFSKHVSACVLALSLTSVAAIPAAAGSYDLGTLSSSAAYTDAISTISSSEKFTDVFTYAVPESYTGGIASLVRNLSFFEPFWEGKKVSLNTASDEIGDTEGRKSYSDLASGEYASDVTGESRSLIAGIYPFNFVATLSPDPDTTSIAMLLAGLGLVITTARRRTAHR